MTILRSHLQSPGFSSTTLGPQTTTCSDGRLGVDHSWKDLKSLSKLFLRMSVEGSSRAYLVNDGSEKAGELLPRY